MTFQIKITPELIRQVDLAESSPSIIAQSVSQDLRKFYAKHDITPYDAYWYCLHELVSMAREFNPQAFPILSRILKEAYIHHYAESGIRLGLVTPEESNGVPNQPESNREDGAVSASGLISNGDEPVPIKTSLLDANGNSI